MNKSESKYFNTALLMDQALLELLEEKGIEYISVKELCERAGVNRSTFYLHYETIGDLVEETVEYVTRDFYDVFPKDPADFVKQIADAPLHDLILVNEDYLKPYLNFVYENKGVFKASVKNPASMKAFSRYSSLQQHIFEPIMERFRIPKEMQHYMTSFYMKGIWAIIEEWLNGNCRETVEQIAEIITACVRSEDGLRNHGHGA